MVLGSQDDYSRIQVGDGSVGVMGLKGVIAEIAQSHGYKTDDEVARTLLERLAVRNYIPHSSRDDYGRAFVREFRKFLGQPYEETDRGTLNIVVLGPGCSQCDRLEQTVMQVLTEMGLPAALEHVTDLKEIAQYGMVRTPALVINGKVTTMGTVPSPRKIKDMLTKR